MDTPVGVLCLYPWCMFAAPARKCMVMFIYICIYIHSPQMVMLTFSCLGFQLKRSMYDYKLYVSLLISVYSLMDSDERASLQKKKIIVLNVKPYLCMLRMS